MTTYIEQFSILECYVFISQGVSACLKINVGYTNKIGYEYVGKMGAKLTFSKFVLFFCFFQLAKNKQKTKTSDKC